MSQQAEPATPNAPADVEGAVLDRYGKAAEATEAALCCPVPGVDPSALAMIPKEIVEIDYGCGDPTAWVGEGDTVVDLGSGSGKACYMMAIKVGAKGRVIGVDFNDRMLGLARRYQDEMAEKLGYANVTFEKAKIQDLATNSDRVDAMLKEQPIGTAEEWRTFEDRVGQMRTEEPLVASDSVDAVVSNCVLNLVRPEDKADTFREVYRVLRRGGRAVISDIVCDEDPTPEMMADPDLWSGCISGAYREDTFLKAFEAAGFHGIEILARSEQPWRVVDGVEFRSITVRAYKGKEGPCLERNQAVIYKGPWLSVQDDDGHIYRRGSRIAVCDKTFQILTGTAGPYAGQVEPVLPRVEIALDDAGPFGCVGSPERHPRETKGMDYRENRSELPTVDCSDGSDGSDGACC